MLNDLARDQGVADCLAKFAIDTSSFQKLEAMYGHLPPEQFNKMLKARVDAEATTGPKLPPVGAGNPSPYDSRVGPAPMRPIITAQPLDKTFIGVPDTVHGYETTNPSHPPVLGTPVGSAAGTNPGKRNPFLPTPKLPR